MDSVIDRHLSDEQLLSYADGELTGADAERARLHLDACWSCRTRLEDIESVIREVVHLRNDVLLPSVPSAPRPWPGLQPRLAAADAEVLRASVRARVTRSMIGLWSTHWRWASAVACCLIVTFVVLRREPVLSARELIGRAEQAERLEVTIAHRQLVLEARRLPTRDLVARHRIDVWRRGDGLKARRVYDERDRLVAGEWVTAEGQATVYRSGAKPQHALASRPLRFTRDEVWRLEPSVRDFATLVTKPELATVTAGNGRYMVTVKVADAPTGVTAATLTLAQDSLRPLEERLEVALDEGPTELRVIEAEYAVVAPSAFPADAFQPNPEWLAEEARPTAVPAVSTTARRISEHDLAALELDVVTRLDAVGAFLGEQVVVTRAPASGVTVEALVDSVDRKAELLRALAPIGRQPALRVAVSTVEEALQKRREPSTGAASVRSVDVPRDAAPLHGELSKYFSEHSSAETASVEHAVQRFTMQALDRSLQARLRARAVTQLVQRFTAAELRALPAGQLAAWRAGLDRHVTAFQRETEELRRQLEPIFFALPPDETPDDDTAMSDEELAHAAARLFSLGSSHDVVIGRAFAASVDDQKPDSVTSPSFWQSLRRAERLAARLHEWLTTR